MIPFFFGPSKRQLFGIYDAPPGVSHRGVILCYPWGQEYLSAHKSFGALARRLARNGNHVLRFDYYGSGDSAGAGTEATLSSWLEDLDWALDEIRDMAELRSIALVGLRLGAAIATKAALKHDTVQKLVLWDPVFDGEAYLEELFGTLQRVTRSVAYQELEAREGGEVPDVWGVPLTPSFRKEIQSITAAHYTQSLPSTLLITNLERREIYSSLQAAFEAGGTKYTLEHRVDPKIWLNDDMFGSSGIPVEAVRCIAEWLK